MSRVFCWVFGRVRLVVVVTLTPPHNLLSPISQTQHNKLKALHQKLHKKSNVFKSKNTKTQWTWEKLLWIQNSYIPQNYFSSIKSVSTQQWKLWAYFDWEFIKSSLENMTRGCMVIRWRLGKSDHLTVWGEHLPIIVIVIVIIIFVIIIIVIIVIIVIIITIIIIIITITIIR